MANPIYAIFKDNNGTVLPGQVTENPDKDRSSRKDPAVEVIALDHEIYLPTDEFSGKINSKRKHGEIKLLAEQDAVTPYFYKAIAEHWKFQNVDLEFWSPDKAIHGQVSVGNTLFFTVSLERAAPTYVKPVVEDIKNKEYENYPHLVEIGLKYEYIKWFHHDGAIFGEDKDLTMVG